MDVVSICEVAGYDGVDCRSLRTLDTRRYAMPNSGVAHVLNYMRLLDIELKIGSRYGLRVSENSGAQKAEHARRPGF
jgi:hypothetical protein